MNWMLYLMAGLYMLAGITHFLRPRMYKKIMPKWVPWPMFMVYLSGLIELVLGILLLPVPTRSFAAVGLIILLILIFPANVEMMKIYKRKNHPFYWLTVLRLPIQLLLIWWAWQYV